MVLTVLLWVLIGLLLLVGGWVGGGVLVNDPPLLLVGGWVGGTSD